MTICGTTDYENFCDRAGSQKNPSEEILMDFFVL